MRAVAAARSTLGDRADIVRLADFFADGLGDPVDVIRLLLAAEDDHLVWPFVVAHFSDLSQHRNDDVVRAFEHIHALSIAAQNEQRRGAFVARVTADIETIARFLEWGGISWILGPSLMLGTMKVRDPVTIRFELVLETK